MPRMNNNSLKDAPKSSGIMTEMVHSDYYHRRFEDYMETTQVDERGRGRIVRTYVGSYYSLAGTEKKRHILKLIFSLLYLVALGVFIAGEWMSSSAANAKLVQLTVMAGICMLLYYGIIILRYIAAKAEMTVWAYKSGAGSIIRTGRRVILSLLLCAAAHVIYMDFSGFEAAAVIITVCCLVSALAIFAICRIHSKQHYSTRPSQNEPIKGAYYID